MTDTKGTAIMNRLFHNYLPYTGEIQGRRNAWFCGAWTRHGFHEDGLDSGIAVAEALGARLPWRTTGPVREAAE